jgi:hypothetical protein
MNYTDKEGDMKTLPVIVTMNKELCSRLGQLEEKLLNGELDREEAKELDFLELMEAFSK